MRINLMDGSLRILRGHPHDIDLSLARAMVDAGHDVHVYGHVDMDEAVRSDFAGVAPLTALFTINPYAKISGFDAIAGEIRKNLDGAHITAKELLGVRQADVWLWPSLYPYQLLACAFARTSARVAGCIHHPPGFLSAGDTAWWRYGFLQCFHAGIDLRAGSIERETCYEYIPLTVDGHFPLLPYPNDGLAVPPAHTALQTIGIFGAQREEKGQVLMRPLLNGLLEQGYRVILQDSNEELARQYAGMDGVICLGHVDNLLDEIARCDLVLAPYHAESYRSRGSGIVMNAMACGVPVVVPVGSAPGRLVEQNGAGTLFSHFSLPAIRAAIQAAAAGYPAIAAAAGQAARLWRQQHGVMKFVEAMVC